MTSNSWLVVTVDVRPDAAESLTHVLSEQLIALGGSAIETLPGRVRTYLPNIDDNREIGTTTRAAAVRSALESGPASPAVGGIDISLEADRDWLELWRTGLGARRLGARIVVAPTWVTPSSKAGDIVIRIDPQMAFGTAEHGTTRGMLRLLEVAMYSVPVSIGGHAQHVHTHRSRAPSEYVPRVESVLDIGTGSAILAIAAAKFGAGRVVALDSDRDALENATENLARNRVIGRVELGHAVVDTVYLGSCDPAPDLVLANLLLPVIMPLLPALASLAPRHGVITGGILAAESTAFLAAAGEAGFALCMDDQDDEWWTGWLQLKQPDRRRNSST